MWHRIGLVTLCVLLFPFAVFVGLGYWAHWLRHRTAAPSSVSKRGYGLLVLGGCLTIAVPIARLLYQIVFGLAPTAPGLGASDRSRILGSMIAGLMFDSAFAWGCAVVVIAGWLLYATWRWQWSASAASVKRDPPYR